jgi:hypothetical protein
LSCLVSRMCFGVAMLVWPRSGVEGVRDYFFRLTSWVTVKVR